MSAPMPAMSQRLDDAIVDPTTYATPEVYDEVFSRLRAREPVRWTEPTGHRPFWTVSKYADIQEVELASDRFLNAPRLVLRDVATEERVAAMIGGRKLLLHNLVN